MSDIITVGLDLAKNVFQVHGAEGAGRGILRKKLRRMQVLTLIFSVFYFLLSTSLFLIRVFNGNFKFTGTR